MQITNVSGLFLALMQHEVSSKPLIDDRTRKAWALIRDAMRSNLVGIYDAELCVFRRDTTCRLLPLTCECGAEVPMGYCLILGPNRIWAAVPARLLHEMAWHRGAFLHTQLTEFDAIPMPDADRSNFNPDLLGTPTQV